VEGEEGDKGKKWGRALEPGQSGNTNGRSKKWHDASQFARDHSIEAMRVLVKVMRDKRVNPGTRAMCANSLLDRGLGRPLQTAAIAVGTMREAAQLSDEELMAIAAGLSPSPPQPAEEDPVIDGEATEKDPEKLN